MSGDAAIDDQLDRDRAASLRALRRSGWSDQFTQGYRERGGRLHQCNCVGCCQKCGTCRTAPWHTHKYCELVQRQEQERVALVLSQRTDGETPGLEYGTY